MTNNRLIPPAELPRFGITISSEQRKNLEARGLFPKRVKVTDRTHAYVESELQAYATALIARRDAS
jgi:predicted DNA-binding transcriptional regulator AlpA